MHKNGSGRTVLDGCQTPHHGLLMTFCSRAYQFLLNWTNVLYRRWLNGKIGENHCNSLKCFKIGVLNKSNKTNQLFVLAFKWCMNKLFFLSPGGSGNHSLVKLIIPLLNKKVYLYLLSYYVFLSSNCLQSLRLHG